MHFFFPNGNYLDPVSAVNGFDHRSGANGDKTRVLNGNPNSPEIRLEATQFDDLKAEAEFYRVEDGLDAEIRLLGHGEVDVRSMTRPRWDLVDYDRTRWVIDHYDTVTETRTRTVQIDSETEEYDVQVFDHYVQEVYIETVPVYEWVDETVTRTEPVMAERTVGRTREVPIGATRTVTRTRWVQVFVPYEASGGGGTAVGGGGGVAGEYEWVEEEYETTESYIERFETETYSVTETYEASQTTVTETVSVRRQSGTEDIERIRDVAVYRTETRTREVPVYGTEDYEYTHDNPVWVTESYVVSRWEFQYPQEVRRESLPLGSDESGVIYVDGRVTRLEGDLKGRLTVVGNEKVRITGTIRYVDDDGDTVMLNGNDKTEPYERNAEYDGSGVMGVIARNDIVFTRSMPDQAELNATFMSVEGRVGIDGFAILDDGTPTKDYSYGLSEEAHSLEHNYDRTAYRTRRFRKESLRRIGGLISNNRIVETYIQPDSNGNAYVDAGFKQGSMKFDLNLIFNPPPNFVEVPRPVLAAYAPIFLVRTND